VGDAVENKGRYHLGVSVPYGNAAGMRTERAQNEGDESLGEGGVHGDDEPWVPFGLACRFNRFFSQREASSSIGNKCFTSRSQQRASGSSLKDRSGQDPFEVPDALAHRGLGDQQLGCRPTEAALTVHREENSEVLKIKFHNQSLCIPKGRFWLLQSDRHPHTPGMHQRITLEDSVLHLNGAGRIGWAAKTAAFWSERDRDELVTGQVLSVFTYDATWTYQERHPDGDELAAMLEGDIDLLLDEGDGERGIRLARGTACLIPAGAWHRVAIHEPSTILFITPVPSRTQHRTINLDSAEPSSQ